MNQIVFSLRQAGRSVTAETTVRLAVAEDQILQVPGRTDSVWESRGRQDAGLRGPAHEVRARRRAAGFAGAPKLC